MLNAHPDLAGKLAAARRLTAGIDRRAGFRRPRRADRRRARTLHRTQRGLCRALRLSLHHRGEGQDQGRHPGRLRDAHRQRPRRPNSTPPAARSSASRCCGCATCCLGRGHLMAGPQIHRPHGGHPPQTQLLTGRAVFTEAYASSRRGVMRDIVTSALPFWERHARLDPRRARCRALPKPSRNTSWKSRRAAAATGPSRTPARKACCSSWRAKSP